MATDNINSSDNSDTRSNGEQEIGPEIVLLADNTSTQGQSNSPVAA